MKHFLSAIALTLVLSLSSIAGDMHGNDSPAPPAPTPTPLGMRSASSEPKTSMPGATYYGDSAQPTLDEALYALLSVFRLVF